jgi:OmpR-family two-component system manganese-sensing response regulator
VAGILIHGVNKAGSPLAKILLIEDDQELTERLREWFVTEGHAFENASSGEDGLQLMLNFGYDVVILDWRLPGMSGLEVCKSYRQTGGTGCIIFLTGKNDIISKEQGLDTGADDYLTKPFDVRELAARIRTVLRRPHGLLKSELRLNEVVLDIKARKVNAHGTEVHLMPKESALLEYLMRHPNRAFAAKDLLNAVWPSDKEATSDTVRSWMRNLRAKLDTVGCKDLISTVSGSGYMVSYPDSSKTN